MRITGGILRGRRIKIPGGGVRPTQDRVRAALFSILGPSVQGRRFLDLFAGSGAVGLEAWSRGASETAWVERDPRAARVLRGNIQALCDGRAMVFVMDVFCFLQKKIAGGRFGVIFCDPPYETLSRPGGIGKLLDAVSESDLIEKDGIVVVEHGPRAVLSPLTGWGIFDERVYGDARLAFFRRAQGRSGQCGTQG